MLRIRVCKIENRLLVKIVSKMIIKYHNITLNNVKAIDSNNILLAISILFKRKICKKY